MLKGKVAIITGSSAGIGAEIAYKFAKEDAAGITLHGRRADALDSVKKNIIDGGYDERKIHIVIGDLTSPEVRRNLIDETISKFTRLDILVNNAGIFKISHLGDSDIQKGFSEMFDVNLIPVLDLTRIAMDALKESRGNVVNISSNLSMKVFDGSVAYASMKAAMNHVTKAAAVEFGPDGVRVNVVCPGYIPGTDVFRDPQTIQAMSQKKETKPSNPLQRQGTVTDVANAVAFLASDNASFLTGVVLPVDGGWNLT